MQVDRRAKGTRLPSRNDDLLLVSTEGRKEAQKVLYCIPLNLSC
jgi:hypothetical protein